LLAELRQIGEDLDSAAFHLERARQLSEGGDDLVLEVDLAVCAGIQRLWKGEPTKAVEDFRQAADLAASTGDPLSLQMARSRQAIALFTIAELDAARSLAEQAGRETAPAGLWAEHGVALTVQCSVACAYGELERAVELGTNARRIAAWSGDAQTTSIALPALVWASAACGDHPAAQRHLDEWSGVGSEMVDYHRAVVHALAGEHDAARRAYARAPASSTDAMTLARSAGFLVELAELLDDDIDLAVPYLVLSEMATREVWFSMGWCQFSPRLAGVAAARLGDRESAERWLGRALDVASKAGARVELARVEANLAELT
jgi:tetratricopeptide (TPR) repeat protein